MDKKGRVVSDEEARRLWQRAAELQAEAAQRLEEQSRRLVTDKADAEPSGQGHSLVEVRAAALGAGISPEFVDRALRELGDPTLGPSGGHGRVSRMLIGRIPPALEASKTIGHPASDVYSAMRRIFPSPTYNLALVDTRGDDPLDGATLVFDVPRFLAVGGGGSDQAFAHDMAHAGVKQVHVTLTPVPGDRPSCEVALRAPLKTGQTAGALQALAAGVTLGGVAAGIGVAATAAIPIVATLGLGLGGVGILGLRWAYRYGIRRSSGALERLLGAVAGDLQTDGAFSPRRAWPEAEPKGGQPSFPDTTGGTLTDGTSEGG